MDGTPQALLNRALWEDVNDEDELPANAPLLAHYTSVQNFVEILKSEELWLSNPLYMNDIEELRWGIRVGMDRVKSHPALKSAIPSSTYDSLIGRFDLILRDYVANHLIDTYVLCFSKHESADDDGRLSMWRGYGANGTGVCMVLDPKRVAAQEESPLILSRVSYQTADERLRWIDGKIEAFAKLLGTLQLTGQELFDAAWQMFERVKVAALFSKHHGFREEQEWRVVYMGQRDREKKFHPMLGYAVTPTGVHPKLKLRLSDDAGVLGGGMSLTSLIDRVLVGPSQSGPLAVQVLKRVLEQSGKAALADKVRVSSIPYRT